ncbi:MAG: hypothetical protein LBE91_20190 [Tannerella sp.]|jgi:hypothetical protein|nr:hypothetical protein [Tannerella sp.]
MTGQELLHLFELASRRTHIVGTKENGVIVALDLEGRFFTVINDRVISKVHPSAILARSDKNRFQNPGGDALWPAPEGACFGYEYATGSWRVPPSVTGAVWEVVSQSANECVIRAEIDLINNAQLGIPCEFERHIRIEQKENMLYQEVRELIRYIGKRTLDKTEFALAPWSLCQFDASETGIVYMPVPSVETRHATSLQPAEDDIWDMYAPVGGQRAMKDGLYVVRTKTPERFQLALSKNIAWIEYMNEGKYRIKRYARDLPDGQRHIDIADVPPDKLPSGKGVSLSVYCDPSGFVELEACGGCTEKLEPGAELYVNVITEFEVL